jgi:hypothetical protein
MQRLLASLTIVLLLGMVFTRVLLMRRSGIRAMHFGKIDKKDFLIPPFAFLYFYMGPIPKSGDSEWIVG